MSTMSKTAALEAASKSVTSINRRSSTDYVFYDCGGPDQDYSEEIRRNSYQQAVISRSARVARNALAYMGKLDAESEHAIDRQADDYYSSHTAKDMLDAGIKAFGTGPTPAELAKGAAEYWDSL